MLAPMMSTRCDLPPTSRTSIKFVKSVNQESDGHEKEQIIGFLRQAVAGIPIKEVCSQRGPRCSKGCPQSPCTATFMMRACP